MTTPTPRRETKLAGGHLLEAKEVERNGVRVGELKGYIASWAPDTGGIFGVPDRFERGAFRESIEDHKARGNRQVRLKDQHGRTVGGFPIDRVREDEVGLYGEGEINLEVQQGREAFSLARQGVLTEFSVGFTAQADRVEDGIRVISKAILWEGSIVDEPANQAARILEVKSYTDAQTTLEAAAALLAQREDIPAAEFKDAALHLERQLAAFGAESPFPAEDRQFYTAGLVETFSRRDLEDALATTGRFSVKAGRIVAARYLADAPTDAPLDAAPVGRYDGATILGLLEDIGRDL